MYITERGRAKLEIGLGRGKQLHDRRRDIAERDSSREVERAIADADRVAAAEAAARRSRATPSGRAARRSRAWLAILRASSYPRNEPYRP